MLRVVQITVSPSRTDELLREVGRLPGLTGLRVQRGISLRPAGDVVSVEVINDGLAPLMRLLDRPGSFAGFTTTEPASAVSSPDVTEAIARQRSEITWEEMEAVIGKESNMTVNGLALMTISGVFAAIGLATNALHVVMAAMLIAPGFEPITRIGLGIVAGSAGWRRGLAHTLRGYLALVLGAAVATILLRVLGVPVLETQASYLPGRALLNYWMTMSPASLLTATLASIAGAILVATGRSVLTAGVMVALALVPAAAMVGMGAAEADVNLLTQGVLRWLVEGALVALFAMAVFGWKRAFVHKRKSLL